MSFSVKRFSLTLILLAASAMAAEAPPAATQGSATMPADLEQQLKSIITVDSADDVPIDFRKIASLQQLVRKQKIGDREVALVALKVVAQTKDPNERIFAAGFAPILTSRDPVELVKVWGEELSSKDPDTQKAAGMLLYGLELAFGEKHFDNYASILSEKREAMPLPLLRYMYSRDPGRTFLACVSATRLSAPPAARAESIRRETELLYAHHVIENGLWYRSNLATEGREEAEKAAAAQLAKLAEAPEWWVRFFAANLLAKQLMWSDAVTQKLSEDKNEAVRQTIAPGKPEGPPSQPEPPSGSAQTAVAPRRHVTVPVDLDPQRMAKPSTVAFDVYVEAKAGGLVLSDKRYGEQIYFATEIEIDGKWHAYIRKCALPPDENKTVKPPAQGDGAKHAAP